jgi:hypothetical protein
VIDSNLIGFRAAPFTAEVEKGRLRMFANAIGCHCLDVNPATASPARDRHIADALFVIQIVGATVFGVAQFSAMQTTVEGVSTTWFVFWLAVLLVNLVLAINAHGVKASRVKRAGTTTGRGSRLAKR